MSCAAQHREDDVIDDILDKRQVAGREEDALGEQRRDDLGKELGLTRRRGAVLCRRRAATLPRPSPPGREPRSGASGGKHRVTTHPGKQRAEQPHLLIPDVPSQPVHSLPRRPRSPGPAAGIAAATDTGTLSSKGRSSTAATTSSTLLAKQR